MTENTHILLLALLNRAYFWDVNIADLDVERNSAYIIRRVFELGDIDEIGLTHGWYGTVRCREALLTAEYLRESAIIQGMVFLDIPDRASFKASSKHQYHVV